MAPPINIAGWKFHVLKRKGRNLNKWWMEDTMKGMLCGQKMFEDRNEKLGAVWILDMDYDKQ